MMVTSIPFIITSIMCKIPPFECCHSQDTYNLCSVFIAALSGLQIHVFFFIVSSLKGRII